MVGGLEGPPLANWRGGPEHPPVRKMERAPKENRFEFVVLAGKRARQLLNGALPREEGEKKIAIAQKEILRRKVVKVDDAQ